jgi:hypothetical protein
MKLRVTVGLLFIAWIASASTIELQPETEAAWKQFVAAKDSSVGRAALNPELFLEVDRSPGLRARVRGGEIFIEPGLRGGSVDVPSGLIHDWVGSVFIPDATGERVVENARSFERYPEFYKPSVLEARTLRASGDACAFSLLLRQKVLFVDAALDGQYECNYSSLPPTRWYSITSSTCIREILNFAHADEHRFEPDTGDGFVWRLHSVEKYEQADGGVYVEIEAAALSRPIPGSLRWMVRGLVERISRAALLTSLRQTRDANTQNLNGGLSASDYTANAKGKRY